MYQKIAPIFLVDDVDKVVFVFLAFGYSTSKILLTLSGPLPGLSNDVWRCLPVLVRRPPSKSYSPNKNNGAVYLICLF